MKIRSNLITRETVGQAVVSTPGVTFIDSNAGYSRGWYEPIREFKPRSHEYGFEIFLTGSSPYAAAHQSYQGGETEKAATWDEWGVVIDKLYRVDPHALIGHYTSRADFLARTADEAHRIRSHHDKDGYQARSHRAPWLRAA